MAHGEPIRLFSPDDHKKGGARTPARWLHTVLAGTARPLPTAVLTVLTLLLPAACYLLPLSRIAINFVINFEEGSEPSIPDGDPSTGSDLYLK